MKNFRVQIRAYGYYADFTMSSVDEAQAFENTLVDKLGKKGIVWEKDGFSNLSKLWLTYEEVTNDPRPVQTKEVLGVKLGA
jgi:hypothetical protein